jgi:organic radical activating enzyme
MWDMTLLTQTLKENGRKVHIETSGAYPLTGHGIDLFISKENKLPTQAVYDNAHELKVIIFNKHDFVLRKNKRVNDMRFYFSSRNGVQEEMTPFIVDYVMSNPKWRVSLQTHKYFNIP